MTRGPPGPLFVNRSTPNSAAVLCRQISTVLRRRQHFDLREVPGLKKKPSTSELIDWLKLLLAEDIPPEVLRAGEAKEAVPPLHGALLKNEQDIQLFERLAFMARRKA